MVDRMYDFHRLRADHQPVTGPMLGTPADQTAEELVVEIPGRWASRGVYACGPFRVILELAPTPTTSAAKFEQAVLEISRLDVRTADGLSAVDLRRIPVQRMASDLREAHMEYLITLTIEGGRNT